MSDRKPQKHVIFLGAGASASSGYPLANELRLLLSSQDELARRIAKTGLEPQTKIRLMGDLNQYKPAMDLFRYGAFETVDEFCKLAKGTKDYAERVDDMRKLTRFVLSLPSPETAFQNSEYYPFVQRLFDDSLHRLRDEIRVLSFNYDPYLEFVLMRAAKERGKIVNKHPTPNDLNSMAGGFADPKAWIPRGAVDCEFAVCKLHGSIVGVEGDFGHSHLFEKSSIEERVWGAFNVPFVPFIAFPWELFDEKGEPFGERAFPKIGYGNLGHGVFMSTWERAWAACTQAEKISFVGLSMHEFLDRGFRYLFRSRTKPPAQIVVANLDARITDEPGVVNSYTRTMRMLGRTARTMMDEKLPNEQPRFKPSYSVRTRPNFREFIEHEME